MTTPIRVLLVEDHVVVRAGFRLVLDEDPEFVVVGEAGSAEQALNMLGAYRPDVVVLDLHLPGVTGVQLLEQLQARPAPPRVLILSSYDDDDLVQHALDRGAAGYLLKTTTAAELKDAIKRVWAGEAALSPAITQKFITSYRAQSQPAPHEQLSPREREVLALLAEGLSNREIAQRLHLSVRTVGNHIGAIYRKLDVNKRPEAVLYALQHHLVAPSAGGETETGESGPQLLPPPPRDRKSPARPGYGLRRNAEPR